MIKKLIVKKLDVKMVTAETSPTAAVNLCEEVMVAEELVINYTYMDLGTKMMILDIWSTC